MSDRAGIYVGTSDLTAIYDYVRKQREFINQFPGLLALIQSFESWYQGLSWYDKSINLKETTFEAIRRRDAINALLGAQLPDDWIPADSPQTSPPAPPKPPLIPAWVYITAGVASVAAVALTVAKKFTPLRFL